MGLFSSKPRKKFNICIVGAGFAGLHAAQYFKPDRFDVTVVDPQPYIEWLPNIHEILSGVKKGDELRLPRQPIIERLGHKFRMEKVTDISANAVTTEWGKVIPFDACIVCTGGGSTLSRVPGANQYTFPFKSVENCQEIARRLKRGTLSSRTTRVTVVGGGFGGVEALGEMLRAYRYRPQFEFQVVDLSEQMLAGAPGDIDAAIRRHTEKLRVDFHMGQRVQSVEREGLVLSNGQALESDITIWTGGVTPNPLVQQAQLADEQSGWGKINSCLQSQHDNIFVVGDAAHFDSKVAKQAFHAVEMGRMAAENAERLLTGKKLRPYKPASTPQLVTFGDLDAFMIFDGFAISSSLLGAAKEVLFTMGMLQMSPPTNAQDVVRHLNILQNSVRNIYMPNFNPVSLLNRLPKAKLFRAG